MIGVEDSTDISPNDHPGAIWLSLSLVEMNEPEEGASREATTTGLLQCDTSNSDDSKLRGWTEGTDHSTSTDVSDTNKKRTMASTHHKKRCTNPPLPPAGERGEAQFGPSFPVPRFTWARSISTKSDVMQAPPPTVGSGSDFSTEVNGPEYRNRQKLCPTPPMPPSLDIER